MAGSDTPSSTTSTQKLDPFIKEQVRGNLDFVNQIIDDGYQGYTGPGVADLNGQVQQGIAGLGQMAQNNPWQGLLDQAAGGMQDTQNYDAQQIAVSDLDMGQFMNPYLDQVVDSTLADVNRSRQMAVNQTQDQALASGAFAGNRSAIADAMTNSEYARQAAIAAGQLRASGFNTALEAAQNAQGMDLAAQQANQRAGLDAERLQYLASHGLLGVGTAGNAMQSGNYQNAVNAGLLAQENQQAQNDWQYQQYLDERNWPILMANLRTSAIGGSPMGGSTVTTAPGGGTNRAAGALGGALSGAAAGSTFGPWGTAIGAGVGLLGGMFA